MSNVPATLRHLFSPPGDDKAEETWKPVREAFAGVCPEIRWPAAMPDVIPKIAELLDVKLSDVLVTAWNKATAVGAALRESKNAPAKVIYLELAKHTINSTHHPYIAVRIGKAPTRKFEFTVSLRLELKGFVLKIHQGSIEEIRSGTCKAEGTFKYHELVIARKDLGVVSLPGTIPLEDISLPEQAKTA